MFSVSDINIKNTKLNTALDNSTLDAISRDSNVILAQIKDTCSGIVILATIYIQTCIKPSGAFLCLSFIKNVH